jgi:NAD(P)-dependent dehydrogenase (short-subunit alcohol dehydrogenase family)
MAQDYFQLQGQTALVTGASSGLGAHFARVLSAAGARVVLAARRRDKLAEQVDALRARGAEAGAITLDVTSPDSVAAAFAELERDWGQLDILINNAGVASDPIKFLDTTEPDWYHIIETNLNGAWRVAQAGAKHMTRSGNGGSIVNIGSIYGLHTGVLKAAYNVSKTGVVQLTKSMAMELCRQNIRVNALCPGWFLTDINSDYFRTESGERYIRTIPARRMGELEELSVPLLLLASRAAGGYMNGSVLTVDGGMVESPV